ncbi:MAG TPA: hypothetical protein VFV38_07490 [Ktedonobacteraceae bacterium]|nr:hypothetical protein [Ktedonobacteraceae bacterium]
MKMYTTRYGLKCARLLDLSSTELFKGLVPALYPVEVTDINAFLAPLADNPTTLLPQVSNYLMAQKPTLSEDVKRTCGPLPWIIRSSGAEDTATSTNAGGFESLVCRAEGELYGLLARVILSGMTQRARQQSQYLQQADSDQHLAIPAFIQPLIQETEPTATAEAHELPYISEPDLRFLQQTVQQLHQHLQLADLDCEWVARTSYGLVSVTSLTTLEASQRFSGQAAFGFNLFSTQQVQNRYNSTCYWLPEHMPTLWQGHVFRTVEVKQWFLVQARPATGYQLIATTPYLTAHSQHSLRQQDWLTVATPTVISPTQRLRIGSFIAAESLNLAWQRYLQLPETARANVAAVFVEHGTRTEHAGIMFAQTGIPLLQIDLALIPGQAQLALADTSAGQAYFHIDAEVIDTVLHIEQREQITLPQDCLLITPPAPAPQPHIEGLWKVDDIQAASLHHIPALQAVQQAPWLTPATRERIIQQSLYPAHNFVLSTENSFTSPTVLAQALRSLIATGEVNASTMNALLARQLPEQARHFLLATLAASKLSALEQELPLLLKADRETINRLLQRHDAYLNWQMLAWEQAVHSIPTTALARLLRRAADDLERGLPLTGLYNWFDALLALQQSMNTIAIYTQEEKERYFQQFAEIAVKAQDAQLDMLKRLCQDNLLAAYQVIHFLSYALHLPDLFTAYIHLRDALTTFEQIGSGLNCAPRQQDLNQAYRHMQGLVQGLPGLQGMQSSLFHVFVETYDATAKELLLRLAEGYDAASFTCYIELQQAWLEMITFFAADDPLVGKATRSFAQWLNLCLEHPQAVMDYFLAEVEWRGRVVEAQRQAADTLSLDNPHQLHNVLHQWSLALAPIVPQQSLPAFIQQIAHFATTFSEQENRVLRLQRDLFEIELPMTTHKASFVFEPGTIQVEFSEPPETTDDEIARMIALKAFFHKFNRWFPAFHFIAHYEKVVGSWTLFVTVRPTDQASFSQASYRDAFALMRFLFDSSYHFSHESNNFVSGIAQRFTDAAWQDIFTHLVAYRKAFDDHQQFTDLKIFALGTFFTDLCMHPELEQTLLTSYQSGFEASLALLQAQETVLQGSTDFTQWRASYQLAKYLSLVIAAVWPEQIVALLPSFAALPFVGEILCCNLLKRADVANSVWHVFQQQESADNTFLYDMLLHYAPTLLIEHQTSPEALATFVLKRPHAYKRPKQYLLHRYADQLPLEDVAALVADVDSVPLGYAPPQEQILERLSQNKRRFDIHCAIPYEDAE